MFQKKLKRLGACLLTFSLAFGAIQFPAIQASASESENIAGNAMPTASGIEADTLDASKAIDGDKTSQSSRWSSEQNSGPAWIQLQWDTSQTMKNFCIYWERRNVENYRLEISDDGNDWETVWSNPTYPTQNNEVITLEEAKTAAYLRLYIETINSASADPSETSWQTASVYEIEVYEDEVPDDRSEVQKAIDAIAAPAAVAKGDTQISMPTDIPVGSTVRFCADYEQVIGEDGTIYAPVEDKTVKGFYELTLADGSSAQTSEFTVAVPGQYTLDEDANEKPAVIPELQEWYGKTGEFAVAESGRIIYGTSGLKDTAETFAEDYKDITGLDIEVKTGTEDDLKIGDFYLSLSEEENGLGKEGYTMDIDDVVLIEAEEETGAYWATRSILQILKQENGCMPKGIVRDYPKYEVRAFSLDVGRKPFTLDTLYDFAKDMSWYKMNSFQVHLSDNLIFLEDYSSMQEAIEQAYAGFRLESGVLNADGESATSEDVYYTKDEFRDFIQDSRAIGVNIVPEFDMPAHALGITRAFQDYMTKSTGGNHAYLIEELNLEPEVYDGAVGLAKSLWEDYFEGDDPVFDEDVTVHIGTDEYHGVGGAEPFRKFSRDMINFVQGTGRTVRMWGSLTNKGGTTEVPYEGVQLNIWNTGYANPQDMYNLGYDLINTLEGPNYIVPAAGYYNDYINAENIYGSWQPNDFSGTKIKAGDDQMLGACYAIWHDSVDTRANGISEYDSFDRFFKALPAYGAKLWGDAKDRDYSEFLNVASKVGEAPNTDMYAEVDFLSSTVAEYTFEDDLKTDSSINRFDLTEVKNATQTDIEGGGKAIQLTGGESYAETPLDMVGSGVTLKMKVKMDSDATGEQILCESKDEFGTYGTYAVKASQKNTGKVGFSREGYDYSFDYTLPKDEWVELTFVSGQSNVALYVDGELVDNDPEIRYANHETVELSAKLSSSGITKVATMLVPFGRIGSKTNSFQGQIDYVKITSDGTFVDMGALSHEGWQVSACSSSSDGAAAKAIDDDSTTIWHTDYSNSNLDKITEDHPHTFEVTLPNAVTIDRLTCLPRQSGNNGRILEYSIVVTNDDYPDGKTVVDHQIWKDSDELQTASFEPIEAKTVKLLIYKAVGDFGSIAELNLYEPIDKNEMKSMLETEMSRCADYDGDSSIYTEVSWNKYLEAKDVAETIYSYTDSTANDYYSAYVNLQQAIDNLIEKPESKVSDLDEEILSANDKLENLDEDVYTTDSIAEYEQIIRDANAVLKNPDASYMEIAKALAALQNAQLVTKVDAKKAELSTEIETAESKLQNTAGYTESSIAELRQAVEHAKTVLNKTGVTVDELDTALSNLKSATLVNDTTNDAANNTSGNGSTSSGNSSGEGVSGDQSDDSILKTGKEVTAATGTYRVTNAVNKEVTLIKGKDAKNVTIPATVLVEGVDCKVVGIGNNAFKGSKKLTKLVIGDNVTTIGNTAFSASKKLTQVTIGKNVTTIGKKAFFNCKKLKKVTVKGTAIKKIGAKALKGTNAKITVKLPKMKTKQKNALKKLLKTAKISSKAKIK